MRFLFVDGITAQGPDSIAGFRVFGLQEPLRYGSSRQRAQVAPGAISEAIGQLASWHCLASQNFFGRPVFLFADRIDVKGAVRLGSIVTLEATIHEQDAQSMRFSGRAMVGGEVVQEIANCSGSYLPLADVEDPQLTRARYEELRVRSQPAVLPVEEAAEPYPLEKLAGKTLALEVGRLIHTQSVFAADEPFYRDHFPRFPVTPIVILNEMIGAAAARLFGFEGSGALRPRRIEDIKIRSFVRPGEACDTVVAIDRTHEGADGRLVIGTAEISKAGRRILRGRFTFEIDAERAFASGE